MLGFSSLDSFRVITGSIPTFCHTFSFVIFTSIFLPETRVSYTLNLVVWIYIESVLELLQSDVCSGYRLTSKIAGIMLCNENCQGYFVLGTFDKIDLLSILAGGALAYSYLAFSRRRKSCVNM
jgi:hypothetical protein